MRPHPRSTSEHSAHQSHSQTTTATTTQDGDECPRTTPTTHHQDPRTTTGAANTDNDLSTTMLDRQRPPLPQATRIAHPHQLPNPQATTERLTTHNPGPPTSDEERPPQPPTNNEGRPQTRTTATTLDRQRPALSIDNSHHRSQATNAAHQQRRMTRTDNDDKRR